MRLLWPRCRCRIPLIALTFLRGQPLVVPSSQNAFVPQKGDKKKEGTRHRTSAPDPHALWIFGSTHRVRAVLDPKRGVGGQRPPMPCFRRPAASMPDPECLVPLGGWRSPRGFPDPSGAPSPGPEDQRCAQGPHKVPVSQAQGGKRSRAYPPDREPPGTSPQN